MPLNRPRIAAAAVVVAVALAVGAPVESAPVQSGPARAFDYLLGVWRQVKDGQTLTRRYESIHGGSALVETVIADEANTVISTTVFSYHPDAGWTATATTRGGTRAVYQGPDGEAGLEQVRLNDQAFDPAPVRIVYRQIDADRLQLDWQTRQADGSWLSRDPLFEFYRVDRPVPPAPPGRIAFISNRSENFEIYTMAPDGSDVRNLSADPASDHFAHWIAGGTRLAFRSQRGTEDGSWERWEIDRDGTDLEFVPMPARLPSPAFGAFPALSPDGSHVAYVEEVDGEQDVYIARYDGGGARPLAPVPGLDYRPRWSPDGRQVLFISERTGNPELFAVDFRGSNLRQLTDNPGNDRYGRWSPDGAHIAFASVRDGKESLDLYLMNADGSGLRQLTDNDVEDGEITWSPDGKHIAFRTDIWGNSEIAVLDLQTGELRNISNDPGYDAEPVWSPPLPR